MHKAGCGQLSTEHREAGGGKKSTGPRMGCWGRGITEVGQGSIPEGTGGTAACVPLGQG